MNPSIRLYESETQAHDAVSQLRKENLYLGKGSMAIVSAETDDDEPDLFDELPLSYRRLITDNVQRGRSAVVVKPGFGFAARVDEILDSYDPVDVEMPQHKASRPAPLSDYLGIPTLADMKPRARLIPRPSGTSFGIALLSNKPTPFSSLFGLKVLSKGPRNSSFGFPLLAKPKSHWTSSFGLPLLTKPKRSWSRSFGLPLLSKSD